MLLKRRSFIAGAGLLAAGPAFAQQGAFQSVPAPSVRGQEKDPTEPGPLGEGMVRVNIDTPEGLIVLDLNLAKAPITAGNFLKYVDGKRFDGATFYRASHPPGDATYGVLQGGLQNDTEKLLKPIAHEPTTKTGILHRHGTISMARNAPGSATADFFICIGDQSYLDANPANPGDNLGFAAFGQVASGMLTVKKILAMPTGGKATNPVMKDEILARPVTMKTVRRAPPGA
jgi:peptidyl-prolyl cis-trans isomerase A (cyclophilin A)